jgi:hypothetical protein
LPVLRVPRDVPGRRTGQETITNPENMLKELSFSFQVFPTALIERWVRFFFTWDILSIIGILDIGSGSGSARGRTIIGFSSGCAIVERMDVVFLLLSLVALANLALALFVLRHNPKIETNRVFALTALSASVWAITNALFQFVASSEIVALAAQFSYLSAIVLGASFLHFAWIFPRHRRISNSVKYWLWSVALVVGLLSFVPGTVIRSIDLSGHRSIETAPGVYLIAAFMVVSSLWAFSTFAWHHSSLHRVAREQSRWVLTGSALTASIGLVCNLFLPLLGNYSLVWLGPVSTLFFVGFSIYAIVAHRLFDIRLIIKKTLVYSLLVAAIGAGYSGVEHGLTEVLQQSLQNSSYAWIANIGGALVVSLFAAPLRHWLEKQLSRVIYHHHEPDHIKHQSAKHRSTADSRSEAVATRHSR